MTEAEKANNAEALVGKNAMSGFLALMNAAPEDIEKVSGAVNNCKDAAKNMADTMQDNLEGQLTILKSQLQELAISFGDLLMPAVRSIVSGLQGMVDVLNAMPDGVKRVIMIVALLAAALGPVLIIIGKTLSAIGTIMTWAPKLAGAISAVKGAFAALSATMMANPIAIVIVAIVALVAAFIYLWSWRMWKRIPAVRRRQGQHRGMWCGMVLRGSRCRFLLRRSGLRSWQGMRRRIRSVCSILMWRQRS